MVFGPSARAFGVITVRVLDIDGAHLEERRTDLSYLLVEMHTADNHIVSCVRLAFTTLHHDET